MMSLLRGIAAQRWAFRTYANGQQHGHGQLPTRACACVRWVADLFGIITAVPCLHKYLSTPQRITMP